MSAKVVSLFDAHDFRSPKRWTNQDVAEIYRVGASLTRAGLPIECEEGQTDEGDRWYAFCNAKTGDVIVHFALIDDKYVAQVCHLSVSFTGTTLSDIVEQFLTTYPVVLPDQKSASANRIWMHPASGLAAFVATLYFLLEMTKSAEAQTVDVASTFEDRHTDKPDLDLATDCQKSQDALQTSKQLMRWVRLDNSGAQDGPRMVAITAAALIAGILMDSKLGNDTELTFDPKSVLDALNLPALSESLNGVVEEVMAAAEAQIAKFRAELTGSDKVEARTAYHAEKEAHSDVAGLAHAEKIAVSEDEQGDALIIDLEGDLGVPDHGFEGHLRAHMGPFAGEGENGLQDGVREGPGRHIHTIAAPDDEGQEGDHDLAPPESPDQNTGDGGPPAHEDAGPLFVEQVQDSNAIAVLKSLGFSATLSSEFDALAQLISGTDVTSILADTGSASSQASASPATSARIVSTVESDPFSASSTLSEVMASATQVDLGSGSDTGSFETSPASGRDPLAVPPPPPPPVPKSMPGDVLSAISPEPHGGSHSNHADQIMFANDFSIFDPVEVLRAFLDIVEDVGFAEFHDSYFLFDAFSVASHPSSELAFESVELMNGDEVNLIGQASTFDLVRDALETT